MKNRPVKQKLKVVVIGLVVVAAAAAVIIVVVKFYLFFIHFCLVCVHCIIISPAVFRFILLSVCLFI